MTTILAAAPPSSSHHSHNHLLLHGVASTVASSSAGSVAAASILADHLDRLALNTVAGPTSSQATSGTAPTVPSTTHSESPLVLAAPAAEAPRAPEHISRQPSGLDLTVRALSPASTSSAPSTPTPTPPSPDAVHFAVSTDSYAPFLQSRISIGSSSDSESKAAIATSRAPLPTTTTTTTTNQRPFFAEPDHGLHHHDDEAADMLGPLKPPTAGSHMAGSFASLAVFDSGHSEHVAESALHNGSLQDQHDMDHDARALYHSSNSNSNSNSNSQQHLELAAVCFPSSPGIWRAGILWRPSRHALGQGANGFTLEQLEADLEADLAQNHDLDHEDDDFDDDDHARDMLDTLSTSSGMRSQSSSPLRHPSGYMDAGASFAMFPPPRPGTRRHSVCSSIYSTSDTSINDPSGQPPPFHPARYQHQHQHQHQPPSPSPSMSDWYAYGASHISSNHHHLLLHGQGHHAPQRRMSDEVSYASLRRISEAHEQRELEGLYRSGLPPQQHVYATQQQNQPHSQMPGSVQEQHQQQHQRVGVLRWILSYIVGSGSHAQATASAPASAASGRNAGTAGAGAGAPASQQASAGWSRGWSASHAGAAPTTGPAGSGSGGYGRLGGHVLARRSSESSAYSTDSQTTQRQQPHHHNHHHHHQQALVGRPLRGHLRQHSDPTVTFGTTASSSSIFYARESGAGTAGVAGGFPFRHTANCTRDELGDEMYGEIGSQQQGHSHGHGHGQHRLGVSWHSSSRHGADTVALSPTRDESVGSYAATRYYSATVSSTSSGLVSPARSVRSDDGLSSYAVLHLPPPPPHVPHRRSSSQGFSGRGGAGAGVDVDGDATVLSSFPSYDLYAGTAGAAIARGRGGAGGGVGGQLLAHSRHETLHEPTSHVPLVYYRLGLCVLVEDPLFPTTTSAVQRLFVKSTLYPVTVRLLKAAIPGFSNAAPTKYTVYKRYSEFRVLYTQLVKEFPQEFAGMGEFPDKVFLGRYDPLVVSRRLEAFNELVTFVVLHPVLSKAASVTGFLAMPV
ncbi:hypothetical protein BC831DRAFT_280721 [Entophlyctis helioformis]|nr:hypothetical protein BC831DRAFT_280721 [Entophlyctis helioformis]